MLIKKINKINTENYKHNYLQVKLSPPYNIDNLYNLIINYKDTENFNRVDSGTLVAHIKHHDIAKLKKIENIFQEKDNKLKAWVLGNDCFVSFSEQIYP